MPVAFVVFGWIQRGVTFVDQNRGTTIAACSLIASVAVGGMIVRRKLRQRALAAAEVELLAARERSAEEEQVRKAAEDEARRVRVGALAARFGEERAEDILAQRLWVGASVDAVVEMFGSPAEVAETVRGSKIRRVLKYFPEDRGHFGLKVVVDDDAVTGWEKGSA